MDERLRSIYVDVPFNGGAINVDDFVVTVGKNGHTNSVYHVAEVKVKHYPKKRMYRHYLKVYKSDLITLCRRDKELQNVMCMSWYKREKKRKADA